MENLDTEYTDMVNNGQIVPAAVGVLQEKDKATNQWRTAITNPLYVGDVSETGGNTTMYFGQVTTDPNTGKYQVHFTQLVPGEELFVSDLPLDDPNEVQKIRLAPVGGDVRNQALDVSGKPLSEMLMQGDYGGPAQVGTGEAFDNGGPFCVGLPA